MKTRIDNEVIMKAAKIPFVRSDFWSESKVTDVRLTYKEKNHLELYIQDQGTSINCTTDN